MVELSKPLLQLGISYFTYTRSYDTGERVYLTSHRETLENYIKKKWYLVGNVEGKPSNYKPQNVFWSALPKQYVYDANARSYGIDHGMFMIEPHDNYCDFYGFATKKDNIWVQNVYLNKIETIKNFTLYFKDKGSNILKKADSAKILLPFHNDPTEFMGNESDVDFSTMYFKNNSKDLLLTNRQLQCAHLLSKGHTIKEIANKMGLSPRTLEDHVHILKKKFSCRNKSELIIKILDRFKNKL